MSVNHAQPPRIVILDGYTLNPGDNPWDPIACLGKLTVHDRTPSELIVERSRGVDIVLTNKVPLSTTTLAQLPDLRFISVLATGYNVVDVEAAHTRGIVVSNVPEYGTASVAQHVFALLLELCNRVSLHAAAVAAGEWVWSPDFCFWHQSPMELTGQTMGIVGLGRIGRRVGELAHAFGMKVIAAGGQTRADPGYRPFAWKRVEEVFAEADVITLHCPLTNDNSAFVNRALLRRTKRGAFFINTARGGLVDEAALADALRSGQLSAAAVDVISEEPMRPNNPLLKAPNCIVTPHMAWASLPARQRLLLTTARNIEAFCAGQPINIVK
jgi:glycerate dehydrogenase